MNSLPSRLLPLMSMLSEIEKTSEDDGWEEYALDFDEEKLREWSSFVQPMRRDISSWIKENPLNMCEISAKIYFGLLMLLDHYDARQGEADRKQRAPNSKK